jgi:hypothetical protein
VGKLAALFSALKGSRRGCFYRGKVLACSRRTTVRFNLQLIHNPTIHARIQKGRKIPIWLRFAAGSLGNLARLCLAFRAHSLSGFWRRGGVVAVGERRAATMGSALGRGSLSQLMGQNWTK